MSDSFHVTMSILGKGKLFQIYVCSTLFCNSFLTSPQINQNIGFNRKRRSTKWYIDTTFSSLSLFMVWVSILWEETSPANSKVPQEFFLIYVLYPFLYISGPTFKQKKFGKGKTSKTMSYKMSIKFLRHPTNSDTQCHLLRLPSWLY